MKLVPKVVQLGLLILELLKNKSGINLKLTNLKKVILNSVLYIPSFRINIVNKLIYYNIGGVLLKYTLYIWDCKTGKRLNTIKNSFYLEIKKCDIFIRNIFIFLNYAYIISKYNIVVDLILQKVIKGYVTLWETKLNNIIPKNQNNYKIYTDSEQEKNVVMEKLSPE